MHRHFPPLTHTYIVMLNVHYMINTKSHAINLSKGKILRMHALHEVNSCLGFIEAVHQWKWKNASQDPKGPEKTLHNDTVRSNILKQNIGIKHSAWLSWSHWFSSWNIDAYKDAFKLLLFKYLFKNYCYYIIR